MHETIRIVDQLRRAYDGDAWYGPSVRAALEGVDARMATARPFPAGHSIYELVLHLTSWTREITRRLHENVARDPEQGDWPAAQAVDDSGWRRIIAALDAANAELVEAISSMNDDGLMDVIGDTRDRSVGSGVSRYVTLHGLVQHHVYHAGQISLLKKVLTS
jgi:uncharacterized damage-inducible protein DinB